MSTPSNEVTTAFMMEVRSFMTETRQSLKKLTDKTNEMTDKTNELTDKTNELTATMGQHSRILHTMYAFRKYPNMSCKLTGELLAV